MAENVEEKIVAAKFDASDFEKGVNKTIKKLDELEKKLDMKSTGEAIESISKKTKEASESASKSLENLSNRFTTFTGMLKQKLLSGLADQIVGVFFKLEQSMLRFAKSMSFDQISAGMAKYESALTSVRMIVNSYKTVQNDITGVQKKIHYTQEEAYSAIDALQTYADETSYSMSQMTDAMSKMVSAGVSLEQAQKNVQGIANACAAAGVNAQDASRAFYNLSQAYSSGSLKYTDYRSLQLLNMTNENFENQLIAAGIKAGTLEEKKDNKGNAYYVTKKSASNKKVTTGKKFTRSQAADALKYGWAGTDVMDYLFGNKFFVDIEDFKAAKTAEEKGLVSDRKEYLAGLKDMEGIKKYIEGLADSDERKKQYKALASDKERTEYLTRLSEEAEKVTNITEQYKRIDTDALKTYLGELEETDERRSHYKSLKGEKERKEYLKGLSEDTEFLEKYIKSLDESDKRRQHYEELKTEPERQQYLKDLTADAQEVTETTEKALGDYIMSLEETDERREKFKNMTEQEQKKYLKQLAAEATALGKIGRKYDEIAIEAFLAAREARNLNDVINAIADYVSSKWTKVFENLIGQLDDASDFFTALAEGGIGLFFMDFADWIADVSEAFNEGGVGSQHFRDIILQLDEALGNLLGIFNDLLPDSTDFGTLLMELSGELSVAMQNFSLWTQKFRDWLGLVDSGDDTFVKVGSRAQQIQRIFANLSGVFNVVSRLVGIGFSTIARAIHVISPLVDGLINALEQVTAPIGRLGARENVEPFNKLSQAISNVFIPIEKLTNLLGPAISTIGTLLGIVGDFFLGAAIDTVTSNITFFADTLGIFLEILGIGSAQQAAGEGVLESLARQAREFGEACQQAATAVGDFLKGLIKDLRVLLGLDVSDEGENKSIFANLQNFFETNEFIQNAKGWFAQAKVHIQNWVEQAVKDVQTWFAELPEKVNSALMRLFYEPLPEGNLAGDSAQLVETPLKVWLNGAIKAVGDFVAELPKNILNAFGTAFDFFGTLIDIVFGGNQNGEKKAEDKAQSQGSAAAEAVQRWINDFLQKLKFEIRMLPIRIKLFFTIQKGKARKALQTIKEWFNTNETGKAIKEWAASVVNGIKDFIVNLPETIKNLIKGIGEFGRNIIATVKETFSGKKVGEEIEEGFKGISLTGILSTIADIGSTIINQFVSLFTGTDDVETNIQAFIDTVVGFIASIPERLWQVVTDIGQKIGRVFDYIVDAFNGTDDMSETNKDFAERHPVITGLIDSAVTWIQGLPDTLNAAWDSVKTDLTKFWAELTAFLSEGSYADEIKNLEEIISMANNQTGKTIDVDPEELERMQKRLDMLKSTDSAQFEKQHPALANIITAAKDWITSIPGQLKEAWDSISSTISDAFNFVVGYFTGEGEQTIESDTSAENAPQNATEFEKEHEFLANILKGAVDWIKSIPGTLESAWETVKAEVSKFWNGLAAYLTGGSVQDEIANLEAIINAANRTSGRTIDIDPEELNRMQKRLAELKGTESAQFEKQHPFLANMVDSISKWIEDLPTKITEKWEEVKGSVIQFWDDVLAAFQGNDMPKEANSNENEGFGSKLMATIVNFFANIPTYIADGLAIAGEKINEAFDFLSELLFPTAKAESAVDNLAEQLTTIAADAEETISATTDEVMSAATEAPAEAAEEAAKDGTPKNNFLSGLSKFGASLWQLITETIPGFITRGFEYVRDHWQEWGASLGEIFTKLTGIEIDTTAIKDKIIETLQNLPQTLATAYNEAKAKISGFFTKKDLQPLTSQQRSLIETMLGDSSMSQKDKDDLIKYYDKLGYDVSQYSKKSSLFTTIEEVGQDIGATLSKIIGDIVTNVGPWLIEAWNNSIATMDKLFSAVANFFTGEVGEGIDDVGKAIGAEFDKDGKHTLGESLSGLWKSFETFLLETLPRFIGSTFAKLLQDVPKFVGGIVDGFNAAVAETVDKKTGKVGGGGGSPEEQTAALEKMASGMFTNLSTVFGDVVNFLFDEEGHLNQTAKILGIIAIIGLVLSSVGDIVQKFKTSNTDYENKNNAFSVLKWFMGFLDLFLMLTAYTTTLDNAQYERVKEMLTKMQDIINKITETLIIIQALKNGPELIKSITEGGQTLFGGIGKFLGNINDHFKGFAEGEGFWGKIKGLLTGTSSKDVQQAVQSAKGARQIADAAKVTADAQKQVTKELGKQKGFDFLGGIGSAITGTLKTVGIGFGAGFVEEMVGSTTADIISQFIGEFADVGSQMELFMGSLDSVLTKAEEYSDRLDTAIGVFGKVIDLLDYIIKIKDYHDDLDTAITDMRTLSAPINTLLIPFKGDIHAAEMVQALKDLMSLTDEMTAFVSTIDKDDSFSRFKWAITTLSTALSFYNLGSFDSSISNITDEQINGITAVVTKMISNEGMMGLLKQLTPDNMGVTTAEVQSGVETLLVFATAIKSLADGVKGFDEQKRLDLITFFDTLGTIAVTSVTDSNDGSQDKLLTFAAQMESLGGGIAAFSKEIKTDKLTLEDLSLASSALDMVANLTEKMSHIGVSALERFTSGGTTISEFATSLPTVGKNLQEFLSYMKPAENTEWNIDYIANAMYALNEIAKAESKLILPNGKNQGETLNEMLKTGTTLGKNLRGFMNSLVDETTDLVKESGNGPTVKTMSTRFKMVLTMIDAIGYFAGSIAKLASVKDNLDAMIKALISDSTVTMDISKKGERLYNLEQMIIAFSFMFNRMMLQLDSLKDKYPEDPNGAVQRIKEFIDLMSMFFSALTGSDKELSIVFNGQLGMVSWSTDPQKFISNLIEMITSIINNADQLFSLIDTIAVYDNEENIKKATRVFELMKLIAQTVSLLGGTIKADLTDISPMTNAGTIMSSMDFFGVSESLGELQTLANNSELFGTLVGQILTNLNTALDETGTVEAMHAMGNKTAKYLYEGIQAAFDNPDEKLQPTIRPILDDSELRTQMASLFGSENVAEFNLSAGFAESVRQAFGGSETFTSLNDNVVGINGKLDTLKDIDGKVGSLQDEMTKVKDAIGSMKVYLDGDALVGRIATRITNQQDIYADRFNYHVALPV